MKIASIIVFVSTIVALVALPLCILTSCSSDPQARATKVAALKADARAFLTGPVMHTVESLALSYITGGSVNDVHAIANALWTNGGAADLTKTLADATSNPVLASEVTSLVTTAMQQGGLSKTQAINAVAAALSATALSH